MRRLSLLLAATIVTLSSDVVTAQDVPTISGAEVRIDGLLDSDEAVAARKHRGDIPIFVAFGTTQPLLLSNDSQMRSASKDA